MEFFEVINRRRSIRKYKDTPVEPEKLRKIMEAVRVAPSARHRQPWKFIIITDPKTKQEIHRRAYTSKDFILEAPVLIAAVGYPADYVCRNGNIAHQVDLGIAGEHLVLAATALGLGTCWIAAFDQSELKDILGVPEDAHIVALFTLGYPDETPPPKQRKELSEIVMSEKWGGEPPEWAK
ncbi:nitroreductase family protein [bacterium]|nr:nitroreductase family protein [bacterium]